MSLLKAICETNLFQDGKLPSIMERIHKG